MNVHQPQTKAKTLDRLPERLHHFGFVVKDQEVNRQFFEDVLGIPLVATWCERAHNVVVGREINYCHTFYALADGGHYQEVCPACRRRLVTLAQAARVGGFG